MIMDKKSNNKQRNEHRILAGYKREGQKFRSLPTEVKPVGHAHHTVPELVWIAILNEHLGPQATARIVEIIASKITTEPDQEKAPPLLATCMGALAPSLYEQILAELSKEHILESARLSLMPFISLYPEFPITWLSDGSAYEPNRQYLPQFKKLVGELQDKSTRKSTLMVALCVYGALISRTILLPAGVLDDFEQIQDYPNTDNSQRVGALVRSMNLFLVGQTIVEPKLTQWCSYFWQRGLELEPVDYTNLLRGLHE
jgi:hypothetical protein